MIDLVTSLAARAHDGLHACLHYFATTQTPGNAQVPVYD
jgi:hypothetical protein